MRPPVVIVVALAALVGGLAACATSAVARGWVRPVDGDVLRAFAVGADRYAAGQHRGVDLAAPPGAPVRAACGGRVSFAGRVPGGRADGQRALRCARGDLPAPRRDGRRARAGGHARRADRARGSRASFTARASRRTRRGDRRVPRPAGPVRRRAARAARAAAPGAARAPGRPRARAAAVGTGAGTRTGGAPGAHAPAGDAAGSRPRRRPRPAACRGRCGAVSRSWRSGCRSAAGSSSHAGAGAKPARERESNPWRCLRAERRGGGGARAGSLSGR